MAQQLILSMTYFKIPADGSAILERTPFDPGTAFISFLCSEPQLSSVRSKWCGFTKFSPVRVTSLAWQCNKHFQRVFQNKAFVLGSVQTWGNYQPFQVKLCSPLWIFGTWVTLPPLRHHVLSSTFKLQSHCSLNVWLQKAGQRLCMLHCTLFIWCFLTYARISVNTKRCTQW